MSYSHNLSICTNGHIVSLYSDLSCNNFCSRCGAPVISICPHCNVAIRDNHDQFHSVPKYCFYCGKPYPWTEKAIVNLKSSLEDIENLSKEEREQIISDCPDIFSETDATPIAAKRFKKALSYAGKLTAEFLVGFASNFGCSLFTNLLGI